VEEIGESAARGAQDLRVMFSRLRRRLQALATDNDLTPSQTAVLTRLWKHGRKRAERDRQAREEWLARALQDQFSERERRLIVEALSLLHRLTDMKG